jgi:CxxC-x17-CxxC domain-containing protein
MEFNDRQITCLDCGQPFVFTAGEQQFYEKKGFKEEPKRCKNCRDARKQRKTGATGGGGGGGGEMDGNRRGFSGDEDDNIGNRAPSGGGEPRFREAPRGPREAREVRGGKRELFDATCAQCGVATRVPFKPVPGRPVYCKDCYSAGRVA